MLEVDAFDLMSLDDSGRIHTPNASEQLSSSNVDAEVDSVVDGP